MSSQHFLVGFLLVSALGLGQGPASNAPPEIPIRFVGGRVFVRGDLKAGTKSVPAHFLLEMGGSETLLLHARTAGLLELSPGDAVSIDLREQTLADLTPNVQEIRFLEFLTAEFASELEEIPVVGILGFPALSGFRVELDFRRLRLRLLGKRAAESGEETAVPPEAGEPVPAPPVVVAVDDARTVPFRPGATVPRFDVSLAGRKVVRAAIMTGDHDVWISDLVTAGLGRPAGDLDQALLGSIDLTRYAALRPRGAAPPFDDAPEMLLGTSFLANFVVTVDPFRRELVLAAWRLPTFPKADLECFRALADGSAAPLETWLEKQPEHRLASDAATRLLNLRLSEVPLSTPGLERAVKAFALGTPAKRRARMLLDLVAKLRSEAPEAYAIARKPALALALENAGKDEDAEAVHKTRSEIGEFLLEEGPESYPEAYRHLLAAAFGMPRDGRVNLRLGRLYEKTGKRERAWSRYLQAAITESAGAEGVLGLRRLSEADGTRVAFDVDELERALEGRAPMFQPASTHQPNPKTATGRVVLAELFTTSQAEGTGGVGLAVDGLASHFGPGAIAIVEHHLPVPNPSPMASPASAARASEWSVPTVPYLLLDGVSAEAEPGRIDKAAPFFRTLRAAVEERLAVPTSWKLSVHAALEARKLSVKVEADGPAAERVRLRVFLCERTVLYPGTSRIVFHRQVCRAEPTAGGVALPAAAGVRRHELAVDLDAVDRELDAHVAELESTMKEPFALRPTTVAPRQLVVVAAIEQGSTILQAAVFELFPKEQE